MSRSESQFDSQRVVPLNDSQSQSNPIALDVDVRLAERRRLRWLGVVLLIAAVCGGFGWWAGTLVRSPAQVAADSAPPAPPVITAAVESTTLTVNLVTRGEIVFGDTVDVSLQAPPVPEEGRALMSRLPEAGAEIAEGGLLLEVSFRPVILLEGRLPTYRDMRRGAEGPDVIQLQESLARLGWYDGEVDGRLGDATLEAAAELYESLGYAPVGVSRGVRNITIPESELLFVPASPMRIHDLALTLGDDPTDGDTILTLTSPTPNVVAAVTLDEASRIEVGDSVSLVDDLTGSVYNGTVTSVGSVPGFDADRPGLVELGIEPGARVADASSLRIEIPLETTDGAVLAVPVAAVFARPDGSTYVEVGNGDQSRFVAVELGLTSGGLVEVTPLDGDLSASDRVVVGHG